MLKKLDKLLIEKFPHIILAFTFFWLGLVAYGTYDFTNLSTLRDWPLMVSVVDLAWGVTVSAVAAVGGYTALRAFAS